MKYSEELTQEICKYLRAGNNIEDSCGLAGISKETYYNWKEQHVDFFDAIKKAERECKARNIAYIQQAANKTWQAAAWWLERKYNTEFALKQIQEHTGPDGQPLSISLIGGGYNIPKVGSVDVAPTGSDTGSSQVQGVSMAPKGEKNNNGDNRVGTPSTV